MSKQIDHWPKHFPYAPWYLDAVAGPGGWQYVTAQTKEGDVGGILPFQLKKRWGLSLITPPPLAPRLGPHIRLPESAKTIRQQQDYYWDILRQLDEQLPEAAYYRIHWPYDLHYGLPWLGLGWQQRVRYSYVLPLAPPLDQIWTDFKPSLRNKIRKGEKNLIVESSEDWQSVFRLMQASFAHRNVKDQISLPLMQRLEAAAVESQSRKIWVAKDHTGQAHAAIWLLLDESKAYNLLLGSDPALRQSGAVPLLLWQAIQWTKRSGRTHFDFEGSQLPGVESFFRSFGATAWPYYEFEKGKQWLLAALKLMGK